MKTGDALSIFSQIKKSLNLTAPFGARLIGFLDAQSCIHSRTSARGFLLSNFGIINFMIFIYFAISLIRINALDVEGLLISAFGLLSSLITNIVSVLETRG